MGKVKDSTTPASKPAKAPAAGGSRKPKGQFVQFLANLVRTDLYKPMQGRQARLWTAVGLGLVFGLGAWRLGEALADNGPAIRFGIPTLMAAASAWLIFRLVHFPPFAEFLVATEAEMNKVSWTSRADLYRATLVVLVSVVLIAVYLFGVDWLWSFLLTKIGVLQFSGDGAFGSQAG